MFICYFKTSHGSNSKTDAKINILFTRESSLNVCHYIILHLLLLSCHSMKSSISISLIECQSIVSFLTLPDHTRCFMDDTCSGFECCSYVEMLQRSFEITFKLNPCSQTLTIGIERILKHISLTQFEFGVKQKFYLNGFIRLE